MYLSMYMSTQYHQQLSVCELKPIVVFLLTPLICTVNVINVPLSVFSALPGTNVRNPGLVANGTRCDVGRVRRWISVLYIWYAREHDIH